MPRLEYLDYTQITQMKDDPLWYIKKLSIDFTFHKFVKRVNLYVLIYNVTLFLVQVCCILYSPNRKTMIANYGPMMGIILFILCEMFTSRMCESAIKSQLDELHSISWSFANVEPTVILGESRPLFVFAF
ncbi:uncharacterized protein [Tenebrio molitor]|uniref:uncharacterized protein n=1 Tax=Tenebrio molitor TaxID=7067 RepID=UPI00362492AD